MCALGDADADGEADGDALTNGSGLKRGGSGTCVGFADGVDSGVTATATRATADAPRSPRPIALHLPRPIGVIMYDGELPPVLMMPVHEPRSTMPPMLLACVNVTVCGAELTVANVSAEGDAITGDGRGSGVRATGHSMHAASTSALSG